MYYRFPGVTTSLTKQICLLGFQYGLHAIVVLNLSKTFFCSGVELVLPQHFLKSKRQMYEKGWKKKINMRFYSSYMLRIQCILWICITWNNWTEGNFMGGSVWKKKRKRPNKKMQTIIPFHFHILYLWILCMCWCVHVFTLFYVSLVIFTIRYWKSQIFHLILLYEVRV